MDQIDGKLAPRVVRLFPTAVMKFAVDAGAVSVPALEPLVLTTWRPEHAAAIPAAARWRLSGKSHAVHEYWYLDRTHLTQDLRRLVRRLFPEAAADLEGRGHRVLSVDEMTGREFELFLARMFERLRFVVELTPATSDFGADLVLTDGSGRRTVVQAKRQKATVGVRAIQEVGLARQYYTAGTARVVTSSTFTRQALAAARAARVETWDRDELIRVASEVGLWEEEG